MNLIKSAKVVKSKDDESNQTHNLQINNHSSSTDIKPDTELNTANKTKFYSETYLPTIHGLFKIRVYKDANNNEHVALIVGDLSGEEPVLCRMHSECLTSEVFGSIKCECKEQLNAGLKKIQENGRGVLLYLRQEGRGIGLGNKIKAYAIQEQGYDTLDANLHLGFKDDAREYSQSIDILKDLGIKSVILMTNNPLKIKALENANIKVIREAHYLNAGEIANSYVSTKKSRMGHL